MLVVSVKLSYKTGPMLSIIKSSYRRLYQAPVMCALGMLVHHNKEISWGQMCLPVYHCFPLCNMIDKNIPCPNRLFSLMQLCHLDF